MLPLLAHPAALFALLAAAFAAPGDRSTYAPLGFSPDARYFAFAETGVRDGSGFPYADVGVIEVATNRFVARKAVSLEDDAATPEQALQEALRAVNVARFAITPGENPGREVWVRSPADLNRPVPTVFTLDVPPPGGTDRHELLLQQKPAPTSTPTAACVQGEAPSMFRLTIRSTGGTVRTTQVLQDDTALPRSRGCAHHYEVRRVTVFRDALAVVLAYSRDGFEGPDWRHLVVTGRLSN